MIVGKEEVGQNSGFRLLSTLLDAGACMQSREPKLALQGVSDMANSLLGVLRNPRTSPSEATDACKHLLLLAAEGAPCMEHCDPIQLYLTTQVPHSA